MNRRMAILTVFMLGPLLLLANACVSLGEEQDGAGLNDEDLRLEMPWEEFSSLPSDEVLSGQITKASPPHAAAPVRLLTPEQPHAKVTKGPSGNNLHIWAPADGRLRPISKRKIREIPEVFLRFFALKSTTANHHLTPNCASYFLTAPKLQRSNSAAYAGGLLGWVGLMAPAKTSVANRVLAC